MNGLVIMGLTVLVILIIRWLVIMMFQAQSRLTDWYNSGDGNPFLQLLALPVWLVLSIFVFVFTIVALLCGISLARDAYRWMRK